MKTKSLFWSLLSSFALLVVLYVGLINQTVFAAAARQGSLDEESDLRAQVTDLEVKYIDMSSAITLELAKERGFKDASSDTIFASVDSRDTLSLRYP